MNLTQKLVVGKIFIMKKFRIYAKNAMKNVNIVLEMEKINAKNVFKIIY